MPTRAVAYLRVSTEKQAQEGLSLAAQAEKVRAYAALYDLQLVETIVDAGRSAKSLEREGLQKALGMLKAKQADGILVVKLDRLTRSVRDLGELLEGYFGQGQWALMSVGENIDTRTAAGRLVLNVLASVSQWEREATGERTAQVRAYKASLGEYCGGPVPYGYKVLDRGPEKTSLLEPIGSEQLVISIARDLVGQGVSLRKVAKELELRGHKSRTGGAFAAVQISRMLITPAPT